MAAQAYALVGRSYPSDDFALLFAASQTARARRRALMRSADGGAVRASSARSARWRTGREPVVMPARLAGLPVPSGR